MVSSKSEKPPYLAKASVSTDEPSAASSPWGNLDDPTQDGWDSETFAEQVKHQLELLGEALTQPSNTRAETLQSLVADDFRGTGLFPSNIEAVYDSQGILVKRAAELETNNKEKQVNGSTPRAQSTESLFNSLDELAARFQDAKDLKFQPKVVHVQLSATGGSTKQHIAISARTSEGIVEQHATWVSDWKRRAKGEPPLLTSLRLVDFEEISIENSQQSLLADCTASVFTPIPSFRGKLMPGYRDWLPQLTHDFRVDSSVGYPALAIGDVDGDGLEDLYVCQSMGLPNLLLLHQPDGTVREASAEWGIDWLHESRGALLVDLDNDGDQDLAVAIDGALVVAANTGKRFDVRTVIPAADDTTSLAAADFDQDGLLDLYLCTYQSNTSLGEERDGSASSASGAFVYHDSDQGSANLLLHNEDDCSFVDVTEDLGLEVNNARHSYAASWEDYDNDGDLDLYVANDYGPNCLYRNDLLDGDKQRFTEIASQVGAQDRASGMSVAWSDYDRDGWMDVYVSNMFSSAGNRVAAQPEFRPDADPELREQLLRFARGNTLLKNQGDGTFHDSSLLAGVTMGRWAWSSNFADLNNDGWDDILVANGMITGDDSGDL